MYNPSLDPKICYSNLDLPIVPSLEQHDKLVACHFFAPSHTMPPNVPALTSNQTSLMYSYHTSMNLYNFKIYIYFAG